MNRHARVLVQLIQIVLCLAGMDASRVYGELPNPILETVFPAGGAAGETVDVTISGSALDGLATLHSSVPGIRFEQHTNDPQRFRISIPSGTPPGLYDLWAVCAAGLSSPRPFLIGNRSEILEIEPNESADSSQSVPLDVVINGQVEKAGDQDHFRFTAKRGQRVIIECWAERIDSRLRAVLEVLAADGRRLAVNRGYFGIDPLIDFRVPADGIYVVRVHDLVYAGGSEHYYRLDIDTGPRVVFAFPSVVQRGQAATVTLFGWNLRVDRSGSRATAISSHSAPVGAGGPSGGAHRETVTEDPRSLPVHGDLHGFDRVDVDLPAEQTHRAWPLPVRLRPAQVALEGFAYQFPGGHAPLVIGVTDVPVTRGGGQNHSPGTAQVIPCPCEVNGQLVAGDQRDWFAIDARRGEVLYFEAFAERAHSPLDLDLSILDSTGQQELARFSDELKNIGRQALPTDHLDPAGRWVVPDDGRYLVVVRNLIGGLHSDLRRTYRLSVRREEPELQLAVLPHRSEPAALNVPRGGRAVLDVLAFRRRGLNTSIRIAAHDLPAGIECPDVWLGPGVDRGTVVVSAKDDAPAMIGELQLTGFADSADRSNARGGAVVRTGLPRGWGRLTSKIPLAVAGEAPLRISADGHEPRDHHLYGELRVRHSPGGILDVAVYVERREDNQEAPIKIMGIGLPEMIRNQTATIPAGQNKGYISFYLPRTLPVGSYSLAIQAETTVPIPNSEKTETVTVYSNPVTLDVHPPAFHVVVDPDAPRRIKRGQVVQVNYSAHRVNGFISKIHTELASPGRVTKVIGLRGRGVSFVGQIETGTIQIIANEDAPLGQQPFLRLYAIGVLEDEPLFHGSSFLELEVVE